MKATILVFAAMVLSLTAPAAATGTVRIQQADDTVNSYTGVHMRIVNNTLTITSADNVSTVVITGADCDKGPSLTRCNGGTISLREDGTHAIPFRSATFYFNLTDQEQQLPLSTVKIEPHSVLFAAHTKKGTYITGSGTLDQEP
jgi:hypothetical protein